MKNDNKDKFRRKETVFWVVGHFEIPFRSKVQTRHEYVEVISKIPARSLRSRSKSGRSNPPLFRRLLRRIVYPALSGAPRNDRTLVFEMASRN